MCMTRHTHPRCQAHLQQAVLSSRIYARQAYRTDTYVEVITMGSRLIFHRWCAAVCVAVQRATPTGVGRVRCACESVRNGCVHKSLSILFSFFSGLVAHLPNDLRPQTVENDRESSGPRARAWNGAAGALRIPVRLCRRQHPVHDSPEGPFGTNVP